jgi:hypothetical protein
MNWLRTLSFELASTFGTRQIALKLDAAEEAYADLAVWALPVCSCDSLAA